MYDRTGGGILALLDYLSRYVDSHMINYRNARKCLPGDHLLS
jgi:hypothetical protein